jgi:hypothetical protein
VPEQFPQRQFTACSRGDLPLVLSYASSFPTVSSCVIEGASTAIASFVAEPHVGVRETRFLELGDRERGGLVQRRCGQRY